MCCYLGTATGRQAWMLTGQGQCTIWDSLYLALIPSMLCIVTTSLTKLPKITFSPARRYASAGNSDRNVSVCLSVCPSVTRRYCVKTKKLAA